MPRTANISPCAVTHDPSLQNLLAIVWILNVLQRPICKRLGPHGGLVRRQWDAYGKGLSETYLGYWGHALERKCWGSYAFLALSHAVCP